MSPSVIKRLYFGYLADLWIDQPNDAPIRRDMIKPVSIAGLCAISPTIKAAIDDSDLHHHEIDHLILPSGHPEAYQILIKWFNLTTSEGKYRNVEAEYESPLLKYHHVLEIAEALRVTPVLENLGPRYSKMLVYKEGSNWNVQPTDLRRVYTELPGGHALRLAIVKGVALKWYNNDLDAAKKKRIEQITWDIPELWDDLNLLWQEFEKARI